MDWRLCTGKSRRMRRRSLHKCVVGIPCLCCRPIRSELCGMTAGLRPPWTGDQVVDGNVLNFRNYFLNTWLPNREKLALWNHWDTDDVRTRNHAEGYQNGLSSAFETRRKAPLGVFMGIMQTVQNEIERRVRQLMRGWRANQRLPQYVQNEANIQLAKNSLQQWLLF